jgi:hypothetical protein
MIGGASAWSPIPGNGDTSPRLLVLASGGLVAGPTKNNLLSYNFGTKMIGRTY